MDYPFFTINPVCHAISSELALQNDVKCDQVLLQNTHAVSLLLFMYTGYWCSYHNKIFLHTDRVQLPC